MSATVNDGVLCVLTHDPKINRIEVHYVPYDNPFLLSMNRFSELCASPSSTLDAIANYIKKTPDFDKLGGEYRYCEDLDGSYQTFEANKTRLITGITTQQGLIALQAKLDEEYDAAEVIAKHKSELSKLYTKWCKAYAIQKAYRMCHDKKEILSFSHRICGWSNPVHKLTPNFSIELKTNFGYGHASYFYIKMKYKNIEITPFSHWIQYEIAKFSEIIRYSQKFFLKTEEWVKAMLYCKDACNLSLHDETTFVDKYIIEECEIMAKGLEELFADSGHTAENKVGQRYPLDKKGYPLTEYRGEKISGALDFIKKMLEFDKITSVKKFINRIEDCNKKLQPVLTKELIELKPKIAEAERKMLLLKPIYLQSLKKDQGYNIAKVALRKKIALEQQIELDEVDLHALNRKFNSDYPDYQEFVKSHAKLLKEYFSLEQEIKNLTAVFKSISTYSEKIKVHFA